MNEMTGTLNPILDKKTDYSFDRKNFIAPGELTVTITIEEYRDLVSKCATADSRILEANRDKYERDTENKKLKEEIAALKAELYELTKASEPTSDEPNREGYVY